MSTLPEELQKKYDLRFSRMADYRNAVWRVLVRDFFQRRVGHGRTVLDLGSGWGEFINHVDAPDKYAMDLNPEGRKRVAPGVVFLEQDCSAEWALPDESLDFVFTSNFFEHLPDKACLLRTLRQAHRCLKPGGHLLCMGPNIRFTADVYWDFFDHYLPLSDRSLVEGLRMADFEVQEVIPRFLPFTMAMGRQPPVALVALYLRLPLAWRLFGRQFLVTARKPAKRA